MDYVLAIIIGAALGLPISYVIAYFSQASEELISQEAALEASEEAITNQVGATYQPEVGSTPTSATITTAKTSPQSITQHLPYIIVSALLVLFAYIDYGLTLWAFFAAAFALVLLVVFVLDWRYHDIYLTVLAVGSTLAVLAALLPGGIGIGAAVSGALIGGGAILILHLIGKVAYGGRDALAFGDVQLAFMLGLMLGYPEVVSTLLLGVLLSGVLTLGLVLLRRKGLTDFVPVGAAFCLAAIIALLFREAVWNALRFDVFNDFLNQLGGGLGEWLNRLLGARGLLRAWANGLAQRNSGGRWVGRWGLPLKMTTCVGACCVRPLANNDVGQGS